MTNTRAHRSESCPLCRLGMPQALTVVSRHRTSSGSVVYARCDCGRLTMWSEPTAPPRPLITAARP